MPPPELPPIVQKNPYADYGYGDVVAFLRFQQASTRGLVGGIAGVDYGAAGGGPSLLGFTATPLANLTVSQRDENFSLKLSHAAGSVPRRLKSSSPIENRAAYWYVVSAMTLTPSLAGGRV